MLAAAAAAAAAVVVSLGVINFYLTLDNVYPTGWRIGMSHRQVIGKCIIILGMFGDPAAAAVNFYLVLDNVQAIVRFGQDRTFSVRYGLAATQRL